MSAEPIRQLYPAHAPCEKLNARLTCALKTLEAEAGEIAVRGHLFRELYHDAQRSMRKLITTIEAVELMAYGVGAKMPKGGER